MFRAFFARLVLASMSSALAMPAWAQAACPDGKPCGETLHWGAWGLIVIGLLFFFVWFRPEPPTGEDDMDASGPRLVGFLQLMIRRETTGWRRWQWPVLGVFFVGLGIAFLLGGHSVKG